MTQILNDFLDHESVDPLELLSQRTRMIALESMESTFIGSRLPVVSNFFSNVGALFQPKDATPYKAVLDPFNHLAYSALEKEGYAKVRNRLVDIPPGYVGHCQTTLQMIFVEAVPGLKRLGQDLDLLRQQVAHILNGGESLQQRIGIPELMNVGGLTETLRKNLNAQFKKNTVTEGLFGTHYRNISEYKAAFTLQRKVNEELSTINFTVIAQKARAFSSLIDDLRDNMGRGEQYEHLSGRALTDLTTAVERAANAVTLSVVVPSTAEELTLALNKTQKRFSA